MDNPIDVDDFASLFEPAVMHDYVRFLPFFCPDILLI